MSTRQRKSTKQEPIDVAAVTARVEAMGRKYTPDYHRRLSASNRAGHRDIGLRKFVLVESLAVETERLTGRHVTPRFFRLVCEALASRNLKRPSEAEMQRAARYVQTKVRPA